MTINPNVGANFTAFEQDIDSRVREYFSPDNRWDVQLQRRLKCGYEYKPWQMVPLYQAYWKDYFNKELEDNAK
jgi:hypothetical protein